eukprot:5822741-Pyramimonas_sp.AAC.1
MALQTSKQRTPEFPSQPCRAASSPQARATCAPQLGARRTRARRTCAPSRGSTAPCTIARYQAGWPRPRRRSPAA